ncbi:MAG: site-specific integrase [Pyrinomonadaceae bacterium]
MRDWLRVRDNESGSLLCSVRKDGKIEGKGITAQAIYKALAKRGAEARVAHFSPHDLRKTFASELIDASGDLSAVQQLMGHANVETTVGYDRRGERAKKKVAGLLHLPYRPRFYNRVWCPRMSPIGDICGHYKSNLRCTPRLTFCRALLDFYQSR